MNNPWATLQEDAATRLLGDAFFTDIPVVTEDAGDVAKAIQTALVKGAVTSGGISKSGVAVLLLTPRGEGLQGASGHVMCDTTLVATIYERPAANRTALGINKPALDVMWKVVWLLNGWSPVTGQRPGQFVSFESFEDGESGVLAYQLQFRFRQSIP